MFNFLESLDTTKFGKFFKIFLAPIWFVLEWLCFRKYWNIILSELIEEDEIFNFLDRNEFGLQKNKIIKKDLIDNNEFLRGRKLDDCKEIIKKEYIIALTDLFRKYCNINIEEIISLVVTTDNKITKINGESYRNNIYEVSIQYCRLWWFEKAKTYLFWWFISVIIIGLIIFGILKIFGI